jgi:hypothetical protein
LRRSRTFPRWVAQAEGVSPERLSVDGSGGISAGLDAAPPRGAFPAAGAGRDCVRDVFAGRAGGLAAARDGAAGFFFAAAFFNGSSVVFPPEAPSLDFLPAGLAGALFERTFLPVNLAFCATLAVAALTFFPILAVASPALAFTFVSALPVLFKALVALTFAFASALPALAVAVLRALAAALVFDLDALGFAADLFMMMFLQFRLDVRCDVSPRWPAAAGTMRPHCAV